MTTTRFLMGVIDTDNFLKKLEDPDATPLMLAAKNGDLESCQKLVANGADPRETTSSKLTLLHFAAVNFEHGVAIAEFFSKLVPMREDLDGEEAIHYAIRKGDYNFARRLLELRNCGFDNLLIFFVMRNELDFVKITHLLDAKLIKKSSPEGGNALHYAAEFGDKEMCQWLIRMGLPLKSLTRKSTTPLFYATRNKKHGVELVDFFLSKRLGVNHRNATGMTPLHFALQSQNIRAAELLLQKGAKIRVKFNGRQNLLHFCANGGFLDSAKFVHSKCRELIKGRCKAGMTALHIAARRGNLDFCKWLVEHGCRADVLDRKRCPAVYYVRNNEELSTFLFVSMNGFSID